jgi:hypothetical protein
MKSWIAWLFAGLAGYTAYALWFADKAKAPEGAAGPPPGLALSGPEALAAPAVPAPEAPPAAPARVEAAPESGGPSQAALARGRDAMREYRRLGKNAAGFAKAQEARSELTAALLGSAISGTPGDGGVSGAGEREELRRTLAQLAEDVFFSPRHIDAVDFVYEVKRGEILEVLCRRVFPSRGAVAAPGLVCAVNGLARPEDLRAGQRLKVPLGESSIVVVKGEFRLYFLHGGAYVRDFPVGLGREGRTPEAEFVVETRMVNPDWYPQPGVKIPFGDPRNILGTRWLGFRNTAELTGFGIHGTRDPVSIGREESSGCVRLRAEDVERLFDWTPVGTRVRIVR